MSYSWRRRQVSVSFTEQDIKSIVQPMKTMGFHHYCIKNDRFTHQQLKSLILSFVTDLKSQLKITGSKGSERDSSGTVRQILTMLMKYGNTGETEQMIKSLPVQLRQTLDSLSTRFFQSDWLNPRETSKLKDFFYSLSQTKYSKEQCTKRYGQLIPHHQKVAEPVFTQIKRLREEVNKNLQPLDKKGQKRQSESAILESCDELLKERDRAIMKYNNIQTEANNLSMNLECIIKHITQYEIMSKQAQKMLQFLPENIRELRQLYSSVTVIILHLAERIKNQNMAKEVQVKRKTQEQSPALIKQSKQEVNELQQKAKAQRKHVESQLDRLQRDLALQREKNRNAEIAQRTIRLSCKQLQQTYTVVKEQSQNLRVQLSDQVSLDEQHELLKQSNSRLQDSFGQLQLENSRLKETVVGLQSQLSTLQSDHEIMRRQKDDQISELSARLTEVSTKKQTDCQREKAYASQDLKRLEYCTKRQARQINRIKAYSQCLETEVKAQRQFIQKLEIDLMSGPTIVNSPDDVGLESPTSAIKN